MRTLIYARFSSTLQNPRSVEDQIAACQARADAERWTVVGIHSDRAISGAAGIETGQRPGLDALLRQAEGGGVDQVLTEATDRLARHQGDAFAIRERLEYAGVRIFTLLDGVVDDITGTIKGLFDARMRKDLAHRVRRGHRGNIAQGRASGSIAYGYRRAPKLDERGELIRGLREIDAEQADIILGIYRAYHAGQSAKQIADRLNRDGVPPPKRGIWRASTLIGHRRTGFGILCNPIYVGRLEYGRSKGVVDPRTRQRRTRPGDGDIASGDAPHLRIVPEELWAAVQEQIEERRSTSPERQRRPKHAFSGLGECGVCGGAWVIVRKGYWGCSRYSGGKACTNNRLINTADYERRILAGLKEQMLAPEVVSAYLREYHREHARQSAELGSQRTRLERRLAEAQRKVDRLAAALADGAGEFAEVREVMAKARAERDHARRELSGVEALPVLTLHPSLADQYRRAIVELEQELQDEGTRLEAVPRLRKLIARVVAKPGAGRRGVELQVVRHVDEVLVLASMAI